MAPTTESTSYKFIDTDPKYADLDTMPIKIVTGEYANVEFRFKRISISPTDDNLNVTFDVEVLQAPKNVNVDLNHQPFIDFLGEILYDIMVNREDIETQVDKRDEPVDLEADVHEDPHGKDHP
jgi:hypothetical protein